MFGQNLSPSVKHVGGSVMGLLAASGSGQFLIKGTENSEL